MSTWTKKKLNNICTKISSGGTPSRSHPDFYGRGNGHLWVKSKELLGKGITDTEEKITDDGLTNSSAKYYPENSVLVAMYGANAGQMAWLKKPATVNQAICALIVDAKKADWRFVYYSLLYSRGALVSLARGGAQPNLNKEMVETFEIPFTNDLSIQVQISDIIGIYDDLIENNEKRIKALEEMVRLLYTEWFVKFKFPGHEAVKFVDSGTSFGKIPEGWETKRLGDILTLSYGKALREEVRADGNVPVYGSSGIVGHHNKKLVDGPGIVVGRKGNVGSVFWVYEDFYPIDTTFFVKSELPLVYLYYLLKQQDFVTSDAAVPGLNREYAYSKLVLVPAVHLVDEFAIQISPLRDLSFRMQKENEKLVSMRDLLIPQLVTGKRELR